MRHFFSVLWACLRLGFKHSFADKILIVGGFLIYAVIMLLYAGVLRQIKDADLAVHGFSQAQMIWYLGTTELILFLASGVAFKDLQKAFLSEEALLGLVRPVRYAFVRFGFWIGETIARAVVFCPLYFIFTGWLAGGFVMSGSQILGLLLSLPLALSMMTAVTYMIGASCLWFVQSEPAFWVWQKVNFLLGALLWPMAFYPAWAQKILLFLPFHGLLAQGGNWALDLSVRDYALGFVGQVVWAIVIFWLLRRFDERVLRRVQTS